MEGRPTKACSSAAAGRTPWASSRPSRWDTACRTRRSPTARCGSCRHSTAAADVKVRVRNTGDREGAEVVQLYVGLPASRRKVLKAFRKLDPGQRSIVTLTLDQRDLSVRDDHDHTNTWVNPGGRYRLMVGSSSRDLRSTSTFAHQGSNRATLQRSGELVADLVRVWITTAEAMSIPGFGARWWRRSW